MKELDKKSKSICKVMLSQCAEKLKKARNDKNMSIRAFSELSGVSTAVISDFENAKYLPKMDILVRFALTLDITINELLSTMKPDDEVEEAVKVDGNSLLKTFFIAHGIDDKDIDEIIEFMEFKRCKHERMKFFK